MAFGRCGDCKNLGEPIESGVRYCRHDLTWRWAAELRACEGYTELNSPATAVDTAASLAADMGAHLAD